MIKKLSLLSLLLVLSFNVYSVNVPNTQDTTKYTILDELTTRQPYSHEYKLSKTQYLLKYGFDNEAKRIIDTFFEAQKKYIWYIISPTIVYILLIFFYILLIASLYIGGLGAFGVIVFITALAWFFAWGLRIYGIIKLAEHKKIDLLFELINYRKTSSKANKPPSYDGDYYRVK